MTKFRVFVSDTVTYERSCVVEIEAKDIEDACEEAKNNALAGDYHRDWKKEEVDNTPYEAVEADPQ